MASSRSTAASSARSRAPNRRVKAAAGEVAAVKAQKPQRPQSTRREASSPEPQSSRAARAAERRQAIIDAGLDEFIARGFTATRLDDVAKRAGVAKGTIYLHFKDKESMFEELIRTAIVPFVNRMTAPPALTGSVREAIEALARMFIHEVATTRRGDL